MVHIIPQIVFDIFTWSKPYLKSDEKNAMKFI